VLAPALVPAVVFGACAPDTAREPETLLPGVTALSSPAAVGSAEPNLSAGEDGIVLTWLEPVEDEGWALRLASFRDGAWGETRTIVTSGDQFVNWADFPSAVRLSDGRLAAHWLQRGSEGGYDYGVRVMLSDDDGASWTEPWTPHEDGTPTEHGFVSLGALPGGDLGVLWLDGRRYVDTDLGPASEEMALRHRVLAANGVPGPEIVVDDRVCDCCQTAMAPTGEGWVAVYRDRTDDEVRDILAARLVDGAWSEGRPVHRDGWTIAACPVNGPAVDAVGDLVAVAWFTGAGEVPRVQLAFSEDGGHTFSEPVRIDAGDPVGRVAVVLEGSGDALVTWIERTAEGAEIRMRRVAPGAEPAAALVVAATSAARGAGFPRLAALGDGELLVAWTDLSGEASRVLVARVRPPAP
jgi:hypothetical protein